MHDITEDEGKDIHCAKDMGVKCGAAGKKNKQLELLNTAVGKFLWDEKHHPRPCPCCCGRKKDL